MSKILLVEDDNNLREIYEARLQAEGYDIVSAMDGEEALVVAKKEKPDLVISDVMMPRISGFEMLDILRNTDGLKDVRIIMLTALGQAEDKTRADSLGADRYLVKSQVTLEDIVKAAQELLGPADGSTPAPAVTDVPTPTTEAPAAVPAPAAATPAPVVPAPVADAPVVPAPSIPVATPPAPASSTTPDTPSEQPPAGVPTPTTPPEPPVSTPPDPTTPPPAAPAPPQQTIPTPADPAVATPPAPDVSAPQTQDAAVDPIATPAAPEPGAVTPAPEPTTTAPVVEPIGPTPTTPPEPAAPVASEPEIATTPTEDAMPTPGTESTAMPAPSAPFDMPAPTEPTAVPAPDVAIAPAPAAASMPPAEPSSSEPTDTPDATPTPAEQPPVAEPPAATSEETPANQDADESRQAQTVSDEEAAIKAQIESFVNQNSQTAPGAAAPEAPEPAPAEQPSPGAADDALMADAIKNLTSEDDYGPTPVKPAGERVIQPISGDAKTDTPATATPEPTTADADDEVARKKIIKPITEPAAPQTDLNALLAKEGITSLDDEPHPAPHNQNTPHPPGHVIAPNPSSNGVDPNSIAL